jgi:hypothetical protein
LGSNNEAKLRAKTFEMMLPTYLSGRFGQGAEGEGRYRLRRKVSMSYSFVSLRFAFCFRMKSSIDLRRAPEPPLLPRPRSESRPTPRMVPGKALCLLWSKKFVSHGHARFFSFLTDIVSISTLSTTGEDLQEPKGRQQRTGRRQASLLA